METTNEISFFLREAVADERLVSAINSFFKIGVETVDCPVGGANGYLIISEHGGGFKQGVLVNWSSEYGWFDNLNFCKQLAEKLTVEVLLDDGVDRGWILFDKCGNCSIVSVTDTDDGIEVEEGSTGSVNNFV